MNIKNIITKGVDCVYSLWFDLHFLPFKEAIRIPVYISHNTKIKGKIAKDSIKINAPIHSRMISLGISDATFGLQGDKNSYLMMDKGSKIIFNGPCVFSKGFSFRIFQNGVLDVGNNVYFNAYSNISVHTRIHLGDNVLGGWNISIRDSDVHSLSNLAFPNKKTNEDSEVFIGDHVWLSSYTDILKGTYISNNSVTAYRACVGKRFKEENVLLGGLPAKIIKREVNWHI